MSQGAEEPHFNNEKIFDFSDSENKLPKLSFYFHFDDRYDNDLCGF